MVGERFQPVCGRRRGDIRRNSTARRESRFAQQMLKGEGGEGHGVKMRLGCEPTSRTVASPTSTAAKD